MKFDPARDCVGQIIDKMGEASSRAQGLKHVITSYSKFSTSGDNRLYMKIDNNRVSGIIKVGQRNLFHYDGTGKVKEIKPLCVLDFYVHESMQRVGVGKILFEKMLATERIEPRKLAYDRPSPKLIGFLSKHYGLDRYVPQNNNFVIFSQFFEEASRTGLRSKSTNAGFPPLQDDRDRNLGYKKNSQTEFHKVGRSILETANASLFSNNNNEPVRYNSHMLAKTMVNPKMHENYHETGPHRNLEEIGNVPFGKLGGRTAEYRLEKLPLYNAANAQESKKQHTVTPAPWANHGANVDSFKTSGTYGSHYTQTSFTSWNRR
jgi:alpha-tubulin N-acetyltransferase 1